MNNLCIHLHDCRGLEKSHIFFRCTQAYECNSGTWILQSLLDSDMTLEFQGEIPMGSKEWMLKQDSAYCNKQKGDTAKLTFSQCYPNKYTMFMRCRNTLCFTSFFWFDEENYWGVRGWLCDTFAKDDF